MTDAQTLQTSNADSVGTETRKPEAARLNGPAAPGSAATTIVPSQPNSRAASLKQANEGATTTTDGSTMSRASSLRRAQQPQDAEQAVAPTTKDPAPPFTVILCLFQSFAGLLFGWETGNVSGLVNLLDYQQRFGRASASSPTGFALSTAVQSLIVAGLGIGAFCGSLLAGSISSKTGIKATYLFSLIVFMIGIAIEVSSMQSWVQMFIGRIVAGYGVGSLSMLAPLYQAECSPKHLRGTITSTYQLMATVGIFLSSVVNYCMQNVSGPISWRLNIGLQLVWGGLVFIGTLFGPELPRYYVQRGNIDRARKNLSKLRALPVDDPALEREVQQMISRVEEEKAAGDVSYLDAWSKKDRMRLRTTIGVAIQAGQQWSGVNFFFSYGVAFFASAGISDSFQTQVIISAINFISTLPGLYAVEKLGRRQTLLIGSLLMFIGQVVAGAISTAYPGDETVGKVLIFFSAVFIFGFASTWGPLGWTVAAEQFPVKMASYCVAWSTASNWGNNAIIAIIVPFIMNDGYGNLQTKITFIWAGTIVLGALVVYFLVPETAGLSLLQVDELYLSHVPAWKSAKWVPYGGPDNARTKKEASLKLGASEKHNEHVPARDLGADDDE
ncbi:hypothetical protein OIO90_006098 [Microbotryomycetes sp. JL221]|nr:hypothetical protein OIO90_006098 [Microbotryomycetes sp. JL221]